MNKINQHIILRDKRKLGFAEYGTQDGFPIIYCHGSQSSRFEMHYDLIFAINHNLRIITIDRPGHGISDFNQKGSILSFASDVKELIQSLGISKFSVAGMSAGSPFALAISYLLPENIHKTAIISGFAPYNTESKKHLSKDVRIMLNLAKSLPFLLKILLKLQSNKISKSPKKALKGFLKIMSEPDQAVLQNDSVMQVIETMFKEAFKNGSNGVAYEISKLLVHDWKFKLNEIKTSTTFYQGEKDNNVPLQWSQIMADQISDSVLKKYPKEGHLLIFTHAEEIFTNLKPT